MFNDAPHNDQRNLESARYREIVADEPDPLNQWDMFAVSSPGGAPASRLDERVIGLWRVESAFESLFIVGAAAVAIAFVWWAELSPFFSLLAGVIAVGLSALNTLYVPRRRWETWRYDIGESEVDIQQGFVTVSRTRVPMARIQHVDTRRGPLERRNGLATLVLYTAAGARSIPGLALPVAEQARDRIAALANVRDDV